ncbi:MAG: MBL fold metallo-hydrolase [Chitinophagaceae bacterium]
MGTKQDEKFFGHFYPHGEMNLIQSLQEVGFQPEDITDVFLTHLHFDHCGGAVKRENNELMLQFPKATYWSNATHWHAATHLWPRKTALRKISYLYKWLN